jgi:hypothetical protein
MMPEITAVLNHYPNAQPCHGNGFVIIGEPIWKKVWVWGGFSRQMAERHPIRRQFTKHIETLIYSSEFDFEKLGWQEACRLAWEDAARRMDK